MFKIYKNNSENASRYSCIFADLNTALGSRDTCLNTCYTNEAEKVKIGRPGKMGPAGPIGPPGPPGQCGCDQPDNF